MILIDIITFNTAVLLSLLFWGSWFILSFVMTVILFRWDGRESDILRTLVKKKGPIQNDCGNYVTSDGEECFWAVFRFTIVIIIWPIAIAFQLLCFTIRILSKLAYISINKGIKIVPYISINIEEKNKTN